MSVRRKESVSNHRKLIGRERYPPTFYKQNFFSRRVPRHECPNLRSQSKQLNNPLPQLHPHLRRKFYGDISGPFDNSASTYLGHVFVKTRYLILSNAASNTSSVNSLGTILRALLVLLSVPWESKLVGRSSTSSHGHTTLSLGAAFAFVMVGDGGWGPGLLDFSDDFRGVVFLFDAEEFDDDDDDGM